MLEQVQTHCGEYGFQLIVGLELPADVSDVVQDRVGTDEQPIGYTSIVEALSYEAQHLPLPARQGRTVKRPIRRPPIGNGISIAIKCILHVTLISRELPTLLFFQRRQVLYCGHNGHDLSVL